MTDDTVVEIDVSTGEQTVRRMNEQELKQRDKDIAETKQHEAEQQKELKAKAKDIKELKAKAKDDPAFAALLRVQGVETD